MYENLVVLELLKARINQRLLPNLYFWRDKNGHEIDLIAEWDGVIKAIEIKASVTPQPDFAKNGRYFCALPSNTAEGYVIYNSEQNSTFLNRRILPITDMQQIW